MPAMLKANERCYKRTFGLRSVESSVRIKNIMGYISIAHRRTLVSIWSQDRKRSQKIEHGSIFCDRLRSWSRDRRRSQKCVSISSQAIAELSAIACDHMETSLYLSHGARKRYHVKPFFAVFVIVVQPWISPGLSFSAFISWVITKSLSSKQPAVKWRYRWRKERCCTLVEKWFFDVNFLLWRT